MFARLRAERVAGLVLVCVAAAACSSSSGHSGATAASTSSTVAPSTSPSTTAPRPTPKPIAGSQLTGAAAFLGPIDTVPVGDITMAYRQFGRGSDLVLISGQDSSMSLWPLTMLKVLAAKYRVTIFDNRDLGSTTVTTKPFTLPELADDTAALIAALGLDHPAVFGWSTGGEIGLLLAARHSDVLSKLAITGATPGGPKSVLPPPKIIELFASANPDLKALSDVLFSPTGTVAAIGYVSDLTKVPQPPSLATAAAKYDQAEKAYWAAAEPNLDAITVPVLVMNGAGDYAVPPANARYIARRIGTNARLELDPGGRHAWFVEHPAHFFAVLDEFLG